MARSHRASSGCATIPRVDLLTSPEIWAAFLTLFVLELVLGIDNVVFISILTNRLPESQRRRARIVGLSLAMIMRIVLLFFASWIVGLTDPWIRLGDAEVLQFSGRDLILLAGGLFLIYKAVTEIHAKLEGEEDHGGSGQKSATFAAIIVQIILVDLVFSLDSVITAVGMVDELPVMIAAVVLSIGLMMFVAGRISDFVNKHPTVKILALSFLVLIGSTWWPRASTCTSTSRSSTGRSRSRSRSRRSTWRTSGARRAAAARPPSRCTCTRGTPTRAPRAARTDA